MADKPKTKKELTEEIKKIRNELDIQMWGVSKTNDAIKVLYKELEKKNIELRELDKLKSDFVNTVSHELRTPLTTIRESISQILDGVHGEVVPKQKEFLSLCLEDVDRLRRIVDNILDISKLEAKKFKIMREEVDIVSLAKRVIALFELKAKSKGLEIKENFLSEKAMAYTDKDTIIRVFNNLIENAIKFTDKGYLEVSVADENNYIECSVSDTGRGISDEDLPMVFGRFQQFGRTNGPGEKGTGLGLNISKTVIELNHGKIWVDSVLNKGTKFTFTLPKYNAEALWKEHIAEELAKAIKENETLSMLVFGIEDFDAICKAIGDEKIDFIMQNLENIARQKLHQTDAVIKGKKAILIVLPETQKANALKVAERIKFNFDDYLSKEKIERKAKLFFIVFGYPEDGTTEKEIYNKLKVYIE